jgi:hypothetical protein
VLVLAKVRKIYNIYHYNKNSVVPFLMKIFYQAKITYFLLYKLHKNFFFTFLLKINAKVTKMDTFFNNYELKK